MSQQKNTNTIVDEHREMLLISGSISDFQLKNLKTWPFVVFNECGLSSAQIDYDFIKKKGEGDLPDELYAGKVTFDLNFSKSPGLNKAEKDKRIQDLTMMTKFMFWEDTQVEILRGGKKWL